MRTKILYGRQRSVKSVVACVQSVGVTIPADSDTNRVIDPITFHKTTRECKGFSPMDGAKNKERTLYKVQGSSPCVASINKLVSLCRSVRILHLGLTR
jgi:hypothetical protein